MHISPATLADIPALCILLNLLFTQEVEFKPDYQAQSRGLTSIIADPGIGCVLAARRQGEVIGMVNLLYTISTALGERVALLEDLVVAPPQRGGGIGSALLQQAITTARQQGCRRITLLTDHSNLAAQGFYAKHGFTLSAMRPMRLDLQEIKNPTDCGSL